MTSDTPSPTLPLAGRKALVTGGSRRLGRAMVLALGRAGADVAVHYRSDKDGARDTAAELDALGRHAPMLAADLADATQAVGLAREAHEALGGLDLLVNNAAIFERTPLDAMRVEDLDAHWAANTRSVYALTLEAGRRMKAEQGGDVVNVACVSAWRPYPAYVPYSASKAAVVNLTQGFAKVLAPQVRVNGIAPGPILPAASEAPGQGERAVEQTLLRRWGTPRDIACALLFLLRAAYVTGYTLPVDGGRSIT